jgi:hypothetical protein
MSRGYAAAVLVQENFAVLNAKTRIISWLRMGEKCAYT